jgi:superoxide reductase
MATKFYKCNHCGNVVEKVVDSKVPVVCCGEKMQELIPNTVDASNEKHVPVVTRLDDCRIKVEVGSVAHPMTPEHHISFIYVGNRKWRHPRKLEGQAGSSDLCLSRQAGSRI